MQVESKCLLRVNERASFVNTASDNDIPCDVSLALLWIPFLKIGSSSHDDAFVSASDTGGLCSILLMHLPTRNAAVLSRSTTHVQLAVGSGSGKTQGSNVPNDSKRNEYFINEEVKK